MSAKWTFENDLEANTVLVIHPRKTFFLQLGSDKNHFEEEQKLTDPKISGKIQKNVIFGQFFTDNILVKLC